MEEKRRYGKYLHFLLVGVKVARANVFAHCERADIVAFAEQ